MTGRIFVSARPDFRLAIATLPPADGIALKGRNAASDVGQTFAIEASANSPARPLQLFWKRFTTASGVASTVLVTATAFLPLRQLHRGNEV